MVEILRESVDNSHDYTPKLIEIDSGKITTSEEAEIRIRQIRNGFWADFRPGDREIANAHARMAVADEAFGLLSREDLNDSEKQRATYLLIEAREKIMKSVYGHFGRAPDLWADQIAFKIKEINAAREIRNINE